VRDEMRRQTETIVRYYGEISRRVATTGLTGIPGLLELAKQLEIAVGEVAGQELDWMAAEIKRLLDELVRIDGQIQHLRELKTTLEGHATDDGGGRHRPTH
jgi:hypothetical protein